MRQTTLNVFFDIETLTVNRKAEPKKQLAMEYIVSYKYKWKNGVVEKLVPNLETMIRNLLILKRKHIILLAHNGEGYDFAFLRRCLVYEFGLVPKNSYLRNSLNHELETKIRDEKASYLHVARVKSATKTKLEFRLENTNFETKDTLPITHMSVKTIGSTLVDLGLLDKGKLEYKEKSNFKKHMSRHEKKAFLREKDNYKKFDKKQEMSYAECKKYCQKVYDSLNDESRAYCMQDTNVIYTMYYAYNRIYAATYDPSKLTLSQNILTQYEINDLARFQLLNKVRTPNDKFKRLELTSFIFDKTATGQYENMYQYIHKYYKGGLNFYNDKYVGKLVHGHIVHIDLNSSYPTVMRYREFPTFLKKGGIVNTDISFNPKYYYYVQMSKVAFQKLIISQVKSKIVRQIFVKYFNNPTDSVYLQTPHIKLFSMFLNKEIKSLPVISYLKFDKKPFGGLYTIQVNYQKKTGAKKRHACKGEVAGYKVTLNGIYGIPALRPFFPLYEYDKRIKKMVSIKDDLGNNAFHNSERNITFASSVTAYAFLQLLTPLTYNIKGIDKNFYYCDTDSIFMNFDYWNTIKKHVQTDKYALGAWDKEHTDVRDLYILNHKKYALWSWDNCKVEVFAGGIPIKAFKTEKYDDLKTFVDATFHDGCKIKNMRNAFTDDKVIVLYEAETEINKGTKYKDHFPTKQKEIREDKLTRAVTMIIMMNREAKIKDADSSLYYETPIGSFSRNEIFPPIYQSDTASNLSFRSLVNTHGRIELKIDSLVDISTIEKKRKEVMQI